MTARRLGVLAGLLLAAVSHAQRGSPLERLAGLPVVDGLVAAPGLGAPAEIERDDRGMPRITAATLADAAFAQGYAHAQDRLFQMDLFRRIPAGRLAEIAGIGAVGTDIVHRRFGFEAVADRALQRATPLHRALFEAYAAGVNAGAADLPQWPPEHRLLGVVPRPWEPRDSALVALMMFIALAGDYESERIATAVRGSLPRSVEAFVLPGVQRFDAPMTGPGWTRADAAAIPPPSDVDWRGLAPEAFGPRDGEPWPIDTVPLEDTLAIIPGSNAWAVGAARTAHGRAMLASDMHLPLGLPGIWHPVELRWGGGGFDNPRPSTLERGQAVGLSLPGVPGITAGSNGVLAWAATNLIADVRDRVIIEQTPERFGHYQTVDGPRAFDRRVERIEVLGARPLDIDVFETVWGPVLERTPAGEHVAVAWTPRVEGGADFAPLEYLFADSVRTAKDIAERAGSPPLNMIFADAAGNVAWAVSGFLPRREGVDGLRTTAWTDGRGWRGGVPPADRPGLVAGRNGAVWSSNNRGGSTAEMAVVGRLFAPPERAHRVRAMLGAGSAFDEAAFLRMQHDVRTEPLDAYAEFLEAAFAGRKPHEALRLARTYDGTASAASVGYRYVRAFRLRLMRELIGELVEPALNVDAGLLFWPPTDEPVRRLLEERPAHLLPPGHADWDAYLRAAFARAAEDVRAERYPTGSPIPHDAAWGEANRLSMLHPALAALPAEVRPLIPRLSAPPHPQSGDVGTVRVARPSFGASCNLVVSPGREANGVLTIPGGVSGNPFSPNFLNRHGAWAYGRAEPLLAGPAAHTLRLVPGG